MLPQFTKRELHQHHPNALITIAKQAVILFRQITLCNCRVDFASEIAPILRQHCIECHLPGEENGDISLATIRDLQNSEFIVTGDADASYLVELISPQDGEPPLMPKGESSSFEAAGSNDS